MTSTLALDVDRYMGRIGYTGDRTPTLHVLDALVAHHTRTIPFENLDPFLGEPNKLDLSALQRKLVEGGRGGYCFEQNLLLRAVLLELGFHVVALSARVLWNAAPGAVPARSHMLLMVTVDGLPRVVDVGFGGMVLTTTLALETGTVQQSPLESFRLLDRDGDYLLQARIADDWRPLYRFDLQWQNPIDYEAANWYLSTSPHSQFVTSLGAARATTNRRYALRGRNLSVHRPGTSTERRTLSSPSALQSVLENDLHINTSTLDVQAVFARL